jgi:hypothetical protein
MTWEAVFDRLGGLWAAVAVIVGFWIANQFELRRDALQAERDHDREWRTGQQKTIGDLQDALQKLSDATGNAVIMIQQVYSGFYPLGKEGMVAEPWYQKWESAAQSVAVLGTRLQSVPLIEKVNKVTWEGRAMIAAANRPIDFDNPQTSVDEFGASMDRLQTLTREALAFAGQIYQELSHTAIASDNRSWLCKRLC